MAVSASNTVATFLVLPWRAGTHLGPVIFLPNYESILTNAVVRSGAAEFLNNAILDDQVA